MSMRPSLRPSTISGAPSSDASQNRSNVTCPFDRFSTSSIHHDHSWPNDVFSPLK
jgi:hypothetical protein